MRVRVKGWFTLSGMPGSASMSDPSSDPPPSGLTAMMSKCERQKNLNRNQMNFGSKCKQHPHPTSPAFRDVTYGRSRWRKFLRKGELVNNFSFRVITVPHRMEIMFVNFV